MTLIQRLKKLRIDGKIAFYRALPLRKNKIIMWANSFKQYGDSPKYVTEYLLQNVPGTFDIVWVFETDRDIPAELPDSVRVVRYFSIGYLKELHTAKYIICNMRTGPAHYWKKRKGQFYIQTWHSSLRLKKIERDAEDHLPESYIETCKEDSRRIDLILSGCKFSTEIFRRSFWYDGEILESGTPRCDVLLSPTDENRKKVRARYGIPAEEKLALYAPTFRQNRASDFQGLDFNRLRAALEEGGERWTVGARLHPNVLSDAACEGAVPMSDYSDMQELIAAADLLITDYSSCMFDMAIAGKPCILYVPDLEEYLEKERGLYFEIGSLPFPTAGNMEELVGVIRRFDRGEYQKRLGSFLDSIGSFEDGNAAKRVCEYILRQEATKR